MAALVVSAALASPTFPAVDVRFNVGVVMVPKFELVISPLDVSDTDVVPVTEPARLNEPLVAVSSTVAAEMLPLDELVRFPAPTILNSLPADDAPDTFVSPESGKSEMLTNPAALALKLSAMVVRALAAPASPMLPAVDVRFNVGVVIVPKLEFVISPLEVRDTEVVPVTEPTKPSEPLVAVSSTVDAEMLPLDELVRFPPATRLKSVPADDAPDTLTAPESEMLTNP